MNDLTDIQLDNLMSGIGIYDYYHLRDFYSKVNMRDKRRFPTGFYAELDQSRWVDINKGASKYMINSIYIDKKASGSVNNPKITLKYTNSQVTYSPHSIQRFIQRGNAMPKLPDLHLKLPKAWHWPDNKYGVKNVMLPVKSGAFIGSIFWRPGLVYNTDRYNSKKGLFKESEYPLMNKNTKTLYLSEGNLPQHHIVGNNEYHHLSYNASTYISYDQMTTTQAHIYDLHFYDPKASWELQKNNMGDFLSQAKQRQSELSIQNMTTP